MDANHAAKNSSDQDFSSFFLKYYPSLCFFAFRILGDKSSAEEAVASVFERLWLSGKWQQLEKPAPYLYRAVINSCNNINKSSKIRTSHHHLFSTAIPDQEESVLEKIYQTEAYRELYEAMDKLPPGCRNVIELSYKDGLKIQEIADRLDVSPSTVKTQRARGLIILKKLLSSKALALAVMIAKFPG